jgi:tetratricopeptide (TPR) repeat protein
MSPDRMSTTAQLSSGFSNPPATDNGSRGQSLRGLPRAVAAWAAGHRLQAALVGVAGVLALGALVATWAAMTVSSQPVAEAVTLEMALEALDRGQYAEAQALARRLQEQGSLAAEEYGGPAFVLGAAAALQADQAWQQKKTSQYLVASRYLEEADRRGFPPGRSAEGLYLLGRSLYQAGQMSACRPVLQEALKVDQERATEIHRLLAGAYLGDARPNLDLALAENARYLADRRLPPTALHQGLVQRAQILLRQGKLNASAATLDEVPQQSSVYADALTVRGQLLIDEARALAKKGDGSHDAKAEVEKKYRTAIETLRTAESRDSFTAQATSKARFLTGICLQEMGDQRAALAQFERTRTLHGDSPEAIAAAFQGAELLQQMGRDREALDACRWALSAIPAPEQFHNPYVSLDQVRKRLQSAVQQYVRGEQFDLALDTVRLMTPLLPKTRSLELTAEVYQTRAQSLLGQAEQLPPRQAEAARQKARTDFRQAGRVLWRLAKLQVATRQYSEHLWNSAAAYFDGRDYRNTIPVLRKYLDNESRQRRPLALLRLGEALLANGEGDKALAAFDECIGSFPRDASAYRARLLAARAHLEKNQPQKAEPLLRENLTGDYVTPASREFRDSLLALAEVQHGARRYAEATVRLEEFLERYADAPQAVFARYLLADCCRRSALAAEEQRRKSPARAESAAARDEIHGQLRQSLEEYKAVQAALGRRDEGRDLTALEKSMLRNACLAIGSIYFDLGEYPAAVKAYSAAVNRYQHHPEVLEAYVQLAAAYREMDKPAEARSTLEQAKVALARIKTDAPFNETTNYSRQQWSERLSTLTRM